MWEKILTLTIALASLYLCDADGVCGDLAKVGCFRKAGGDNLPLNKMIYNGRETINWKNYEVSIARILCKCRTIARKDGYKVIGIQYYGECWASKKSIEHALDGLIGSNECYNGKYKACDKSNDQELCAGSNTCTSIYTSAKTEGDNNKIDGGYSKWAPWSACSKSCNDGTQERARKCDSPKPANGGKKCSESLGESEEMRPCMLKSCEESKLIPFNCEKMEKDEEFNNLFSAPMFNPKAPFCVVPATEQAKNPQNYTVTADLYSVTGQNTRMGIFFNAQDEDNYDFAYIHVRGDFYCYSTGQVKNGLSDWKLTNSKSCNQVFRSQRWTPLKITVEGSEARFYGNNELLVEWDIISRDSGKGGLLLKNGFMKSDQSEVYFKDLKVV